MQDVFLISVLFLRTFLLLSCFTWVFYKGICTVFFLYLFKHFLPVYSARPISYYIFTWFGLADCGKIADCGKMRD